MQALRDYEEANQEAEKIFSTLGLTVTVSAPIGDVRDERPNILYNVTFSKDAKNLVVQYRLGVGHVDFKKWRQGSCNLERLTADEESAIHTIQRNPWAQLKNKALWASTAAKLARAQKVTVKPYKVFACVCDESARAHGQSFQDYCDEMGGNSDSIKEKSVYEFLCEQYHKISAMVNRATISKLAELHGRF
jgi:hypothetical protein